MPEAKDYPAVSCPKCSRSLSADGEIDINGAHWPVYSCPECLVKTELGDLPLTFTLNSKGEPVDPCSPDYRIEK